MLWTQVRRLGLDDDAPWCPKVEDIAEEDRGTDKEWYKTIWMVFEEPDSCKLALGVNLWVRQQQRGPYLVLRLSFVWQVVFLIILSAIVACVETVPGLHRENEDFWFSLEANGSLGALPPPRFTQLTAVPPVVDRPFSWRTLHWNSSFDSFRHPIDTRYALPTSLRLWEKLCTAITVVSSLLGLGLGLNNCSVLYRVGVIPVLTLHLCLVVH